MNAFKDWGFDSDELNDYRLGIISNVAKAYGKYRMAAKMNPDDLPTLLREISRKNRRMIAVAAKDAIATKDPLVWNSAAFELLVTYFGLHRGTTETG